MADAAWFHVDAGVSFSDIENWLGTASRGTLFPNSRGDALASPGTEALEGPWTVATSKAHPIGCALEWTVPA